MTKADPFEGMLEPSDVVRLRSLAYLFARIDLPDDWKYNPDAHWLWKGFMAGKTPQISVRLSHKEVRANNRPVRRILRELYTGKSLPSMVRITHKCEKDVCVNPLHSFITFYADKPEYQITFAHVVEETYRQLMQMQAFSLEPYGAGYLSPDNASGLPVTDVDEVLTDAPRSLNVTAEQLASLVQTREQIEARAAQLHDDDE